MQNRKFLILLFGWLLLAHSTYSAETESAAEAMRDVPARADFAETNFPFFSSVLDARKLGNGFPDDNLTPRGIILNLGNECWACFDPDLLRVSAIWTGHAVTAVSMSQISYRSPAAKATEGQKDLPRI